MRKGKVLLDFFQKIADSKGRAFGRPSQWAESYSLRPGRKSKEKRASAEAPAMFRRRHFACKMAV